MKGIILAGGSGTRLYPLTVVTSKQLLPVYDKPMIYYPLYTLMSAGIKDILIISTPSDTSKFEALLGDGSSFGIKLSYAVQPSPDGLAQAFIIGEKFIDGEPCAMILGDNIFCGDSFENKLINAKNNAEKGKSTIFGYKVPDPERFGIVEFDEEGNVLSIEEKPSNPKSNYCVTGLYFYDSRVTDLSKLIKPSKRNELEITDLNNLYLDSDSLCVEILDEDFVWMDTGTFESLFDAAEYIQNKSKNSKVAYPEELAYRNGWIDENKLMEVAEKYGKSPYGAYLKTLVRKDDC